MGEDAESTVQRRTPQVAKLSHGERFMRFVETGKAILWIVGLIVTGAVSVVTWGATHVAWASDIQAIRQELAGNSATQTKAVKIASVDSEIRYLSGKIDDLSDQIFLLDQKLSSSASPNPSDIAFKNRLIHRREALERDLRDAKNRKDNIQ